MAVTYLASAVAGDSFVTTITTATIDGTGTDRLVMGVAFSFDSPGQNVTGIGWETGTPEAMTLIEAAVDGTSRLDIYYKVAQTSATNAVKATWGSTVTDGLCFGMTLTGAHQSTPIGNEQNQVANTSYGSGSESLTCTGVATDDMVVSSMSTGISGWTYTIGADQTNRTTTSTPTYNKTVRVDTQPGSAGGVMSFSYTGSSGSGFIHNAVVIKAAGAGAAATPHNPFGLPLIGPFGGAI